VQGQVHVFVHQSEGFACSRTGLEHAKRLQALGEVRRGAGRGRLGRLGVGHGGQEVGSGLGDGRAEGRWAGRGALGGQRGDGRGIEKHGAKKSDQNRGSSGQKPEPRQAQTPAHPPSPILRQSFFKFIGLERFLLLHL
jgi:hypothetical protein